MSIKGLGGRKGGGVEMKNIRENKRGGGGSNPIFSLSVFLPTLLSVCLS